MEEMLLTENGRTQWRIVVGTEASPVIQHAANELKQFLLEVSGAAFPIVCGNEPLREQEILLGQSRHLDMVHPELAGEIPGDDGYLLVSRGGYLMILSKEPRGVLYGVYSFLETYLGCRWFTSTVSIIPKRNKIRLPELHERYVPFLEYRDSYTWDSLDGDWSARNKMNGFRAALNSSQGGRMEYTGFVHTFDTLLPAQEYYSQHPEYFALVDGVHINEKTQPCLTNPDVFQVVLEKLRRALKAAPGTKIVSVSQNDNYNRCRCPACAKIDAEEGSGAGTLLRFVNRIAEALETEFPGILVDTLAYQYSRTPPKRLRPRKNVIVRLSSIECCFSHPIEYCGKNVSFPNRTEVQAPFRKDLEGWSKICKRLYIWDYVTDFAHYLMPYPNMKVLQANIRFYVRNHVKGIFEQGNWSRGGGGLSQLKQYVLAKLLWNPDYDTELAVEEFVSAYYGSAAPYIRRYLSELQALTDAPESHIGFYDDPDCAWMTDAFLERGKAILHEAETVAEDEQIKSRVIALRLGLDYTEIERCPCKENQAQVDAFYKEVISCGITELKEAVSLDDSIRTLRK